jgi:Asp-tRNA(Asn)/Glu-tRNA(Gln) amidotransferase A subunit family amidase
MKIDVSTIEGFDTMTAEQKLEALMELEVPDKVDTSKMVSKELFDRKASELAEANKKLKSKMTEDEQKQAEIAEAAEAAAKEKEALLARVAELEKNNTLREYTLGFSNLGFDEKLATETANLFEEKDSVKFFANMKKFLENYEKAIEKKLMDKTPGPGGNAGNSGDEDPAIKKAKALFGNNAGTGKTYSDVLAHYKK